MNQNPEQIARDNIDKQLQACGWIVQNKKEINLFAGCGVVVREYKTDVYLVCGSETGRCHRGKKGRGRSAYNQRGRTVEGVCHQQIKIPNGQDK